MLFNLNPLRCKLPKKSRLLKIPEITRVVVIRGFDLSIPCAPFLFFSIIRLTAQLVYDKLHYYHGLHGIILFSLHTLQLLIGLDNLVSPANHNNKV